MDLINHAIAGATTGLAFGCPFLGAIIAIAPDLVLGFKRKAKPTIAYNCTHSLLFIAICASISQLFKAGLLVMFCLLSHIILDLSTHGKNWAPPLLYPFNKTRFSLGKEWEFGSLHWWLGLGITILWSVVWLTLSQSVTGFQLL